MINYISKRSIRKRCIAFRDQYYKMVQYFKNKKSCPEKKKKKSDLKKHKEYNGLSLES